MQAKPKQRPTLSTEQLQQFRYYWYAARQAMDQERIKDAYTLFQFCLAIDPNDAQTLSYLGQIYESMDKDDKAMEAYRAAYESDPDNHWQQYLQPLVRQYYQQREFKKALATQDEIDRLSGTYDAYSAVTRCYIYLEWDKPKKAVKVIDEYLKTDSTNLKMLYLRLDLAEQMKAKPKELYPIYERILAITPYNASVLNNYAWVLATNGGDLKKAEQMILYAVSNYPDEPSYLDTYGWILHLLGQDELALFYLHKALWNTTNEDEYMRQIINNHITAIEK